MAPAPRRHRAGLALAPSPPGLLDDVGKAILRELQEDGRRSYTAIAAAVGLSEAAVRQRVKALVDSGLLQIVAVTDPLTLGFGVMASIGISVTGDARVVADVLSDIAEVDYCVLTSGRYDLQLEVVCRDNEHLLTIVNDRIRTVDGVREVETSICLRVHKQTYNYGTP
jgi:Lrp/AsnC family transcriptional regulator for asnA, asnC and gidA